MKLTIPSAWLVASWHTVLFVQPVAPCLPSVGLITQETLGYLKVETRCYTGSFTLMAKRATLWLSLACKLGVGGELKSRRSVDLCFDSIVCTDVIAEESLWSCPKSYSNQVEISDPVFKSHPDSKQRIVDRAEWFWVNGLLRGPLSVGLHGEFYGIKKLNPFQVFYNKR